jgi:hypothetical protein
MHRKQLEIKLTSLKKQTFFQILASAIIWLALCGLLFMFINNQGLDWFARKVTLYQFKSYQEKELSLLAETRKSWEGQSIDNYRLQIQVVTHVYNYNPGETQTSPPCEIHIDVRNKNSTSISTNTCGRNGYTPPETSLWGEGFNLVHTLQLPPSIDDLFVLMKSAFSEPWCGPNGCECDGYYTYSAEYGTDLGYPISLKILHVKPKLFFYPIFCTLAGTSILFPDYEISISQLP